VLPVYNGATTLEAAIDSLQRQTCTDWELLAVDDGSTDDTRQWIEARARKDLRIRVLPQPHRGLVPALQAGLAAARGRFIARMDADDIADPERLEEQWNFLQRRPEVGVAGTLVGFGGDPQEAEGFARHVDWMNSLVEVEPIALNRFIESPLAHPSVMFRSELVARHGGYREGDFPEDYELWLRWLDAGVAMAKVPRVLLTWNDSPGRLSRTDGRYDLEAFYRCKAGYLARWLERHVAPDRPVVVWGAGRPTRRRAEYLTEHGVILAGYIDIDAQKIGKTFRGRLVNPPLALQGANPRPFVLGYVARRGAREWARSHFHACGYVEGRDFLMAA